MPIVAAGMVYAGATATAGMIAAGTFMTAGTMLASIAAGATLVGGALSLVGTATGDKNLEGDGMMIGTVGSLGMAMAPAGSYSAGANASQTATPVPGAESEPQSLAQKFAGEQKMSVAPGMDAAATPYLAKLDTLMKAQESAQQMNLLGNVGTGLAQGYGSYEQSQAAERLRQDRLAEEERRRQNMNITGIQVNTPKMPAIIRPTGLINNPVNPITGSGQTTMTIN